ncbi:sensor histidine kinase [Saccharicrinis fermentans]|uniref:histidine kinase n=1 Tax=Saccharicrinis fermentans DSM 9555 = JCM 21142 TaxID=869213 RepID=W7Y1K6_9BACT|nr:PAS domain S-box protein [Saccharicrinis fermentans]GAF01852.1 oxygen sensor histidine kinase NreB [Saccharicrinis fermentans DSM 9555 = JCM 21142]
MDELKLLNNYLIREVAERKRAELYAAEHANNYRTLYNNSYDGYLILSEDYRVIEFNQAFTEITGYTEKDLVGNCILDVIGDNYVSIIEKRGKLSLAQKKMPNLTLDIKDKKGDRLVLQTQRVVINQNNDSYVSLVILKDVTEQTIATEKLARSEVLYRTLYRNTNDSILIMNNDVLVDYNIMAQKLYPNIQVSNKDIPYVDVNKDFGVLNESVHLGHKLSLAFRGKTQIFEWVHTHVDPQKPVYTLVNITPLKELGDYFYMVVERDITESKKSQNLVLNSIIQTEENERKRISSDLHDGIGPILTTIKLYTQALMDESSSDKKEFIKTKLTSLVDEAVNSISEIAFNISPHILVNYGIIAAIESFIAKLNLSEKFKIIFSHNDVQRLDKNKEITVYRIFTELINNAIKYAKTTKVTFHIEENQYGINLHYRDNGIGFNKEEIGKKKAGMGLQNLRNRVQSFNGKFVLNSELGRGVEVKMWLPKANRL